MLKISSLKHRTRNVGTTFGIDPMLHLILDVRIVRAGNRARTMR